jgi:hypothetical protein
LQLGRGRGIKSLQLISIAEPGTNTFEGNISTPAEFCIVFQTSYGRAALNEPNRQDRDYRAR